MRTRTSWYVDILFLTVTLGALFFIFLGSRPLFVPDEGRYAEIAREMAVSGDYVTPFLNGVKYFEKPVLFYWLGAAAIKIGGVHIWSVRSINGLLGLLGCLLTYFTARKLYNRQTGLLSALILGTSLLYFVMAHMVSLDLPVTLFLAASLYAFLLGTRAKTGWGRRLYFWCAAAAAACAVLTKGLIGIVFPILIVSSWIALFYDWRLLKRIYLPTSLLIFFLIAAPWHILVGWRNPEFFYFYFIEQHFLRYTTMDVGHYQPAWFFIPHLIIGFFPWIVFLPQSIAAALPRAWKQRDAYKTELFFLLWAGLVFLFFSFSKSKLIPYILPVFPPLAILTGHYLTQCFQQKRRPGLQAGFITLFIFSLGIALAFYLVTQHETFAHAKWYLNAAALSLLIGSLAACGYSARHAQKAVHAIVAAAWIFLLLLLAAAPAMDNRTILPFAMILKPILSPQDEVITLNQYYQDLPFYLERRVTIVNWRNELSYGMQHQDTRAWMIDDAAFLKRWQGHRRVFAIMSHDEYENLQKRYPREKFYPLAKSMNNILISNYP